MTPVWWLSWWDPPKGPKGKRHPTIKVPVWTTGYRCRDFTGDTMEAAKCARVEAATEAEAWAAVDVEWPGASGCERRFSTECEPGWMPRSDRFPPPRDQKGKP